MIEALLLAGVAQNMKFPIPLAANQGMWYDQEEQAMSISHLPQIWLEEAKFMVSVAKR